LTQIRFLEDLLQFYAFEELHCRDIVSSTMQEQLDKQSPHRSRMIGIFAYADSNLRLLCKDSGLFAIFYRSALQFVYEKFFFDSCVQQTRRQ
jgi:hypothetical protein